MTVSCSKLRRREHVLDLLICHHDVLNRVLAALEVIEVKVGVAGQEHFYCVISACSSSTLHLRPIRNLDDVLWGLWKHTLIPVKALAGLDTSDQPGKLGVPDIDDRVLGF